VFLNLNYKFELKYGSFCSGVVETRP